VRRATSRSGGDDRNGNEVAGATASGGSSGGDAPTREPSREVTDGDIVTFGGTSGGPLDPPLVGGALAAMAVAAGFGIRRTRRRRG